MPERKPRGFGRYQRRAESVAQDAGRVQRLLSSSAEKMKRHRPEMAALQEDFPLLLRLVKAWASRSYTAVPWKTLVSVLAALLYFVNPFDLIPDALFGVGLVDDFAVIGYVFRSFQKDLDAFRVWEEGTKTP